MSEGYKTVVKGEPSLRIVELICECGHIREAILDNIDAEPREEDRACPACNSEVFEKRTGAPHPTTCHDPEVRSEKLKQRSLDDSRRNMKKNWDRLVDQGKLPK